MSTLHKEDNALLGLRVMTEMHRQQLSIPQLARQAKLPLSTVQKVLAGKGKQTSVWTIGALADVLEVSIDYLRGKTEVRCSP